RAIVSLWNFMKGASSGNYFFHNEGRDSYNTREFHDWAVNRITEWRLVTESHLQWSRSLLVVPYEELRAHPLPWVRTMLDFLHIEEDPDRMACLANHVEGKVKGLQRT
ncbi:unnamed protein product, partial [Meganyctiphanes norvegica]